MKKFSMKDLKPETKLTLIADEKYPLDKAYKLVDNDSISMIKKFITRSDITSEYLSKYVTHTNFEIRKIIALNEKLSLEDLELLLDDLIEEVVVAAISNPSITVEMLDKVLSNTEFLSFNVLTACLKSGKVTDDTQIKNIFKQRETIATRIELCVEEDGVVKLATAAITCKNISEDTAFDIIYNMEGSDAYDDILRA